MRFSEQWLPEMICEDVLRDGNGGCKDLFLLACRRPGELCILADSETLKPRLLIRAHTKEAGHCKLEAMLGQLKGYCVYTSMVT